MKRGGNTWSKTTRRFSRPVSSAHAKSQPTAGDSDVDDHYRPVSHRHPHHTCHVCLPPDSGSLRLLRGFSARRPGGTCGGSRDWMRSQLRSCLCHIRDYPILHDGPTSHYGARPAPFLHIGSLCTVAVRSKVATGRGSRVSPSPSVVGATCAIRQRSRLWTVEMGGSLSGCCVGCRRVSRGGSRVQVLTTGFLRMAGVYRTAAANVSSSSFCPAWTYGRSQYRHDCRSIRQRTVRERKLSSPLRSLPRYRSQRAAVG